MSRLALVLLALAAGLLPSPRAAAQDKTLSPGLAERERREHERRIQLRKAVNEAIDRGVSSLLTRQLRDGSWAPDVYDAVDFREYRNGMTAFVVYTLLKSGLPDEHPAVRRGLVYLRQRTEPKTYPLAAELLALAAAKDPRQKQRGAELLAALLKARDRKKKVWGYPGYPDVTTDLSNTQFAALGLLAARDLGLEVPARTWVDLAKGTLAFQEEPKREKGRETAGFTYVRQGDFVHRFEWARPTGSMTAAGVSVLAIAERALGKELSKGLAAEIDRAQALGVAWLEDHFSVRSNKNGDGGWLYYYLYGLERVGALMDLEHFGDHEWYMEGAEYLLKLQEEDGTWSTLGERPAGNTCFALLFLTRSTATFTGGDAAAAALLHEPTEGDADAEVHLRASGESPLVLWITGFHPDVVELYRDRGDLVKGLRVVGVDYLVDGEVVATVPGNTDRAWRGNRFAWRHPFERPGVFEVHAEARVVDDTLPSHERRLRSAPLEVTVENVLEPWMLEYALTSNATLVHPANVLRATATSTLDEAHAPVRAADGLQFTGWACAEDDPTPRLDLELKRTLTANALVLSQVASSDRDLGEYARIERVRIVVNGDLEALVEVDLHEHEWRKTELPFPEPVNVRRLSIEILSRTYGDRFGDAAGFAEIELVRR